jgi:hypothetical protein
MLRKKGQMRIGIASQMNIIQGQPLAKDQKDAWPLRFVRARRCRDREQEEKEKS